MLLVGSDIYASNEAKSISSPSFTSRPHLASSNISSYNLSSINKHFPTLADPEERLNLTYFTPST